MKKWTENNKIGEKKRSDKGSASEKKQEGRTTEEEKKIMKQIKRRAFLDVQQQKSMSEIIVHTYIPSTHQYSSSQRFEQAM